MFIFMYMWKVISLSVLGIWQIFVKLLLTFVKLLLVQPELGRILTLKLFAFSEKFNI